MALNVAKRLETVGGFGTRKPAKAKLLANSSRRSALSSTIQDGVAPEWPVRRKHVPYDEIHWFWSHQYDVNLQYAGFHTSWDQLVVRGRLDSRSFLACYVKQGRVAAAVAFNRGKELRRVMSLMNSRRAVNIDDLQDESVDLRSLQESS